MEWLAFAGSILGGLIGGLFTFFGVKLTLKHEKEKEEKEALIKAEENKPRLEVIKYSDFNATANKKSVNNDCNVLLLNIEKFEDDNGRARFFYNKDALDNNKLIYVEFELKNTGLTEIEDVCIASNLPKNMSAIELERKEFYVNENLLNYEVWSNKRYIKPGKSIKIRIYYIKEQIISGLISYPLTIWLHDINGRYWEQNFGSPNNDVEKSRLSSRKHFIEQTDIDTAIECFRNPCMW